MHEQETGLPYQGELVFSCRFTAVEMTEVAPKVALIKKGLSMIG
jgi:hypothetical protein